MLGELKTGCPNKCGSIIKIADFQYYTLFCSETLVNCVHNECDTSLPRRLINDHFNESMQVNHVVNNSSKPKTSSNTIALRL